MNPRLFYHRNDNYLELRNLRKGTDQSYLNAATVTATLKDLDGNNTTGETWPLTMSYVAASNGRYRAKLPADIDTELLEDGEVHIDAVDSGSGLVAHWRVPINFVERTGDDEP